LAHKGEELANGKSSGSKGEKDRFLIAPTIQQKALHANEQEGRGVVSFRVLA